MIRPFGLRNAWTVRRLQEQGIWLDLYHRLLQERSPVATALIAPIPWRGAGVASYVQEQGGKVRGFVQMLKRPGRPEADVLFLAPSFDERADAPDAWQELLNYCIRSAGKHGIRRLFASLPENSAEIGALAALGFAVYSNEDILRLARPPRPGIAPDDGRLRPQRSGDAWWLRRLYNLYTPPPVQHAEGVGDSEEPQAVPLAWWELSHQQSYVVTESGEVRGAVKLVSGRRGHWLLLLGDPGHSQYVTMLLRQGLDLAAGSRWPAYCAVRDYQGGLRAILQDHGFEPLTRRSRLVRHVLAPVKVLEPSPAPSWAAERSS